MKNFSDKVRTWAGMTHMGMIGASISFEPKKSQGISEGYSIRELMEVLS